MQNEQTEGEKKYHIAHKFDINWNYIETITMIIL